MEKAGEGRPAPGRGGKRPPSPVRRPRPLRRNQPRRRGAAPRRSLGSHGEAAPGLREAKTGRRDRPQATQAARQSEARTRKASRGGAPRSRQPTGPPANEREAGKPKAEGGPTSGGRTAPTPGRGGRRHRQRQRENPRPERGGRPPGAPEGPRVPAWASSASSSGSPSGISQAGRAGTSKTNTKPGPPAYRQREQPPRIGLFVLRPPSPADTHSVRFSSDLSTKLSTMAPKMAVFRYRNGSEPCRFPPKTAQKQGDICAEPPEKRALSRFPLPERAIP